MEQLWKSALLVVAATLLLRLSGKKSISEMTIASTVIMVSIGEILVQPIISKQVGGTLGAVALFLGTLMLLEWLQLTWNPLERLFSGKAIPLIEQGRIIEPHLRKIRLTVDDLEMRLREKGIERIADVQTATLEINGKLGYALTEDAKPVTYGQLKQLLQEWKSAGGPALPLPEEPSASLFEEPVQGGHRKPIPGPLH